MSLDMDKLTWLFKLTKPHVIEVDNGCGTFYVVRKFSCREMCWEYSSYTSNYRSDWSTSIPGATHYSTSEEAFDMIAKLDELEQKLYNMKHPKIKVISRDDNA